MSVRMPRTGKPKLTVRQVVEIRQRCIYDCEPQVALAREFGVSEAAVSRAVRGITWGPVEAR